MKKIILSLVLFAVTFVLTYIGLCYLVPGLRIKLEAEPMVYFIESITHMVLFKSVISFIIGLVVGVISFFCQSKRKTL